MPATDNKPASLRDLLLVRRGIVFISSAGPAASSDAHVRGLELELAALGYVASTRLRERLARTSVDELVALSRWVLATLAAHIGADREHRPLFRNFPDGVPDDTKALWWSKVLVHFLQATGQPCLFCRNSSTTHVLDPCRHVVCDRCFDGSSYSACPVCEHHVDASSPFFEPEAPRRAPVEQVVFRLLDLGDDLAAEARELFVSLCARPQALSPVDREALVTLVNDQRLAVLSWIPARIPVRENVAIVFGTLFKICPPAEILPHARRHMTTATDVLRFIAVLSGTDGSLQRETIYRPGTRAPVRVNRFKVAKLSRGLRRALLAVLEGLDADARCEDMLRHRSYWVWVGEFLHPHEYAERFPGVARSFQIVREHAPDGTPAPRFHGFYSRLDAAVRARDLPRLRTILAERPGELARRFDHALRLSSGDPDAVEALLAELARHVDRFATPVLLTLRHHLARRDERAAVRVYWPKGKVARGISAPDERALLPRAAIDRAVSVIEAELLSRFTAKPHVGDFVVDAALRTVVVPFNERTASPAAVSLPRGSSMLVQDTKMARLFLHWCEPALGGETTDLDLSVAFYDDAWSYVGVCSFYELKLLGSGRVTIAASAGDLRDAPWPDGATELVDLHTDHARAERIRYAVMVVNNYSGMPFGQLERAFAGLMLREDLGGAHFDPRTVELKFNLSGDNGVFLPLVLDLRESRLHWLDVHSKGNFEFNSVETSKKAIATICPDLISYFGSGVRPSMYDLALLHAAARAERVFVRGHHPPSMAQFVRRPDETAVAFHQRLVSGAADEPRSRPPRADGPPLLAVLHRGDLSVPVGSDVYALFREQLTPTLAASDLLA